MDEKEIKEEVENVDQALNQNENTVGNAIYQTIVKRVSPIEKN